MNDTASKLSSVAEDTDIRVSITTDERWSNPERNEELFGRVLAEATAEAAKRNVAGVTFINWQEVIHRDDNGNIAYTYICSFIPVKDLPKKQARPELVKRIELPSDGNPIINGVRVPWAVSEDGITVRTQAQELTVVTLELLCDLDGFTMEDNHLVGGTL